MFRISKTERNIRRSALNENFTLQFLLLFHPYATSKTEENMRSSALNENITLQFLFLFHPY